MIGLLNAAASGALTFRGRESLPLPELFLKKACEVVTGIFVDSAVSTRTEDEVVDAFTAPGLVFCACFQEMKQRRSLNVHIWGGNQRVEPTSTEDQMAARCREVRRIFNEALSHMPFARLLQLGSAASAHCNRL